MNRVLKNEGEAILACSERLRREPARAALLKSVGLLRAALDAGGKIIVTGIGKSGKVGQKIAATLSSTGSLAVFLHPTEGLHGDLGIVQTSDCILALSHSGTTEELVRLFPAFRSRGTPIVGVGGNPESPLSRGCDAWIDARISEEASPGNLAPTTSTTLALAIGDALAVALMELRGFNADAFARNHPGGALGKRLNLKVSDLMHAPSEVGQLPPTANMDAVVVESTRKKLGAVVIMDGGRWVGMITDGDIRRALQAREKFFTLKAEEVMTRKPVTVTPDLLAYDALRIMENRESQISVLLVVDAAGKWQGLLRLHDIARNL
ncbi:MAG: KpsF/GutQ family sugar-phosphate isomerase [Bdellovibrionales bacterium]|nr:KpsF/GutQ family sugar-phosphate isomerase [Bdellovibrionales bacterium]